MPEPISSSSTQSISSSYDPDADDVGQVCRADAPSSSQAELPTASSPSVSSLVSSVSPPPSALPPKASSPSGSAANSNAQRTTERAGVTPYFDSGVTGAGDSLYIGVAALKGRDPGSGAEIELASASYQVGAQNEAQLGFQRISGSSGALAGSVETFTARSNIGIHNDDGSTGINVGHSVTAIGLEGTATFGGGTSVTWGVAAGLSNGGSLGVRDIDHDGSTELCGRLSIGPATVGICLENPL